MKYNIKIVTISFYSDFMGKTLNLYCRFYIKSKKIIVQFVQCHKVLNFR